MKIQSSSMEHKHSQSIRLGILFGIISALAFSVMTVLVKMVGNSLPTSMLVFFRFAVSLILLLSWIMHDRHFSFKVQQPFRYIVRILAALLAIFLVFYAIKFIPLVDALLLNNTAPLFVPIIAFLMLGAKMPAKAVLGIIIGFIGVGIILQPGHEIFSLYSLIALASGFFAGLAVVQIRLLSKTSSIKQMLFYYFLFSTIVIGLAAFAQWQNPGNMQAWLLLLGIGIFGTIYQVFATLSYAKAPVRLVSPLAFLIIVFGGIFDWLIWGHTPSLRTCLGAALVIMGAAITIFFGQKTILPKKT